MLILLPIACWGLIFLVCSRRLISRRAALLSSTIIWGVVLTLITETLSLFEALTREFLALSWGGAAIVAITLFLLLPAKENRFPAAKLTRTEKALASGIVFLCLATLATALLAPPNNWDSMTYHMSRVVHWLQDRSVKNYPTHIIRQLELNPWAEFAVTHFQALSGNDRFANITQWFSLFGSIIGATLVARQLGSRRRGQILTGVLAASIPMGILQASSTQNDLVTAYWLLCFAWSGMRLLDELNPWWALMAGASLGLAVLTKGTAYIYALPFVIWFSWGIIKRVPRKAFILFLGIALPVFILNGGHYSRNWTLFSNPLVSNTADFSNDAITAGTVLSNLVRNSALHLSTPFEKVNRGLEEGINAFHDYLGLDINDPRTTWPGTTFQVRKMLLHEDYSPNPLHALLAGAGLLLLSSSGALRRTSVAILPYTLCVAAGYFLFCAILKWQPWNSRLHLPLFVIGAPVIGVIFGSLRRQGAVLVTAAILLIAALPWALGNVTRPLLPPPRAIIDHFVNKSPLPLTIVTAGRIPQYFTNRPDLYEPYVSAARLIKGSGAQNIGLKLSNAEAWEYPLWVLLNGEDGQVPRIEHIDVKNPSGVIRFQDFQPELLVYYDKNGYPIVINADL